ncbi:MAG TPA: PepSY-associated TM helix domain-containing protein [Steroidobacteraceae bacterium]|nr:PepSY-associated TM helix domain-containing protein [Steroidobacteraceae bacterium]
MSTVPGSLFRKILFWMHLSSGVVAGVLILVMSITGVAMTYERQMIDAASERNHVQVTDGAARLSADALADRARAAYSGNDPLSLVFDANPAAPVTVSAGRQTPALLNPYTGETIEDASTATRGFMSTMRSWHRYMGGDARSLGGILIDYSNLLFVFIIVSGMYLWLPAVWRWRTVRGLVLFQKKYVNAKVRDFNWHHVFGIWMLVPLFLIAVSGAVISFPWASNLVYAAFGEAPPQRGGGSAGGPGGGAEGRSRSEGPPATEAPAEATARASLQQMLDVATTQVQDWQRITLPVQARGGHVDVQVELRSTERRAPRRTLELSIADASVMKDSGTPAATPQSPGQKARTWFRFVHTGEQYGVIGQTIAGIASLAACFLVYTGLALAYRRLIRPLFRRA